MISLEKVNVLIKEVLSVNTDEFTPRQKSNLGKRARFLTEARNYLELSPMKEEDQRFFRDQLVEKQKRISASFPPSDPDFYPKNFVGNKQLYFNKKMGLINIASQLKFLNFILEETKE